MGYNKCRNYLSPMQIASVHYLYRTDARRVQVTTACDYDSQKSKRVCGNKTWNNARTVQGDIIVSKRSSLEVNCSVSLAEGARIILEKKSKLIINGTTITNLCGTQWGGVYYCRRYRVGRRLRKGHRGRMTIMNDGKLENVMGNP